MRRIKNQEIQSDSKISNLIINNHQIMLLLEHFEISLPIQDLRVSNLCKDRNINEELFIAFVNLYNGSTTIPDIKLDSSDALVIIEFLETSHKFYSEQIYPEIMKLINEMGTLNEHKEMKLVSLFFSDYFKEVNDHFDYENKVFHPYVKGLVEQLKENKLKERHDGYSTEEYKDWHDDIEEKLKDLKNLLIKYLPMGKDHIIRRNLLFLLSELEYDLTIHSYIEELILIPLTIRMENDIKRISQ